MHGSRTEPKMVSKCIDSTVRKLPSQILILLLEDKTLSQILNKRKEGQKRKNQ
jgi:hypothetical protein